MTRALNSHLGERASVGGHPGAARLGAVLAAVGAAAPSLR
jgi:hypothetical protein